MTANAPSAAAVRSQPGGTLLRLIGAFKIIKSLVLVAAAFSFWHLIHKDLADEVLKRARELHLAPGNKYVARIFDKASTVTPRQLKVLGAVSMAYAAMFLTEGIGLLLLKHWAEWMTVITTCGLIPFEIYELLPHHHPTLLKALAFIINVVIAIYIIAHVSRQNRDGAHPSISS